MTATVTSDSCVKTYIESIGQTFKKGGTGIATFLYETAIDVEANKHDMLRLKKVIEET